MVIFADDNGDGQEEVDHRLQVKQAKTLERIERQKQEAVEREMGRAAALEEKEQSLLEASMVLEDKRRLQTVTDKMQVVSDRLTTDDASGSGKGGDGAGFKPQGARDPARLAASFQANKANVGAGSNRELASLNARLKS